MLRLHALVGIGGGLGHLGAQLVAALQQGGVRGLGVKLLQHFCGPLHGHLRGLGVSHRLRVRRFLLRSHRGRLGLFLADLRHGVAELRDLLGELRAQGGVLLDARCQLLDLGLLDLAGLLVGGQLSVAIRLVVRLAVRLLHELDNQVLDHLLHLGERVVGDAHGQRREDAAVQLLSPAAQELGHLLLPRGRGAGRPQLRHGGAGPLQERGQVLLRVALHRVAGDDLDGLGDRLELLSPQLLPRLEVRRLLLARRRQVSQVLLVRFLRGGGVGQVALGVRFALQVLSLRLGLLLTVLRGLRDLRREVLHKHLMRMLGIHLLLFQSRALLNELIM
mmetsp:Transcript_88761/g.173638  ORF Transcript_88761/g.173638 Transcript_88761/m.173638 type:complete len:333 (+) Transcript_88761:472-1470(+)